MSDFICFSYFGHLSKPFSAEFVRWVGESKWPFQIVNDHAFHSLRKTGRPEYPIPSAETLSRDVKKVFVRVRECISKMLRVSYKTNQITCELTWWQQEYDGKLNFATDAWTSPNHKAYIAITVHLEHEGKPLSMLLDLVEVPKSHTGANLAAAFADVLKAFGLQDKIRYYQI